MVGERSVRSKANLIRRGVRGACDFIFSVETPNSFIPVCHRQSRVQLELGIVVLN